jgi:hypothetical protein
MWIEVYRKKYIVLWSKFHLEANLVQLEGWEMSYRMSGFLTGRISPRSEPPPGRGGKFHRGGGLFPLLLG